MGSRIEIVQRAQWGASPLLSPAGRNITPNRGGVAIHWAGGRLGITSHAQCAPMVRRFQREHIEKKKWVDIAYTLLACSHRYLFMGRGPGRRTAANGTTAGNNDWYAICALVGKGDPITNDLKETLLYGVTWLRHHGNAGDRVSGHRDHFPTQCPGPDLYAWAHAGMPFGDASAKPAVAGPRLLMEGMRGTDVTQWQQRLRRLGYVIAADGVFGPETDAATRRFQSRHDLAADGIVGPLTRKAAE